MKESEQKVDMIDAVVLSPELYAVLQNLFQERVPGTRGVMIKTDAAVFQSLPFYIYNKAGHRQLVEQIKATQKPKKPARIITERSKARRTELGMCLATKNGVNLTPDFSSDIVEII